MSKKPILVIMDGWGWREDRALGFTILLKLQKDDSNHDRHQNSGRDEGLEKIAH